MRETLEKGGLGIGASMVAAITASQEQVAWFLGCMVAIGTLISIGFDIYRKFKRRDQ